MSRRWTHRSSGRHWIGRLRRMVRTLEEKERSEAPGIFGLEHALQVRCPHARKVSRWTRSCSVQRSCFANVACVVNRKKSNSRHSHVVSHFLSSAPTSSKNLFNDGVTLAEHIETTNLTIRGSFILLFWGKNTPRSCFLRAQKFCVRTRGT